MIEATGCEYKLNDAKNKPVLRNWLFVLVISDIGTEYW
jgi:hypothetical protein